MLSDLARVVDDAVATACEGLISEAGTTWSGWEVAQGLKDLRALGAGGDCAYDRPSVGASYALWYHGARTHEAARALLPWLSTSEGELRIVDIGCGTGATACAAAIVVWALASSSKPHPSRIVIDAADASPFMVATAERIYCALDEALGHRIGGDIDVSFKTASWTDL